MAPVRVGLVGLSKAVGIAGTKGWALSGHLPYLTESPDYKIVALLNSTAESAREAIKTHNLSPNTKAYGRIEDLVSDADVDLVVVSVNVHKHYEITRPAVVAGKDVLVEWPLDASTARAAELTALAQKSGSRAIVALQTRADPVVMKLKELIDGQRIGKVLSSTVVGFLGGMGNQAPKEMKPFLSSRNGVDFLQVIGGHYLGAFTHVLGSFKNVRSVLAVQNKNIALMDGETAVEPNFQRTSADTIFLQGALEFGAVASISYRHAAPNTVDEKGLRWIITGSEGEIEVTAPKFPWQMVPSGMTLKITGKDGTVEDVETVAGTTEDPGADFGFPVTNTARLYANIAKNNPAGYATFEDAMVVHRLIDSIYENAL